MRRFTLALSACLLAYLTSPAGLFAAQQTLAQPRLAAPRASGQTIEERLEVLERKIDMIQEHLIKSCTVKPVDGKDKLLAVAVSGGRLDTLESESRWIEGRLVQVENELKKVASQGKFVILNHSGVSRYISVNGIRFHAAPGRTELWVPRRVVEAYLPYWESPKLLGTSFWRWTGRHYEMSLHIRG